MTTKSTHRGTCQICGHFQKLPGGLLSKHGYTKRWGFFSGTCYGAENKPFELSCDMIKDAIANARRIAAELNAKAENVERLTTSVWVHEYIPASFQRGCRESRREWRELPISAVRMERGEMVWDAMPTNKAAQRYCSMPNYTFSGSDEERLAAMIGKANKERAEAYRNLARDHIEYAEWQAGRIRNWKPTDLTPIAE